MGGFVGHPIPSVDLYAYGGAEGVENKSYAGPTAGYGNPALNLSGCSVELGSCSAVTSSIVEGTIGALVAGRQVQLRHRAARCAV